MLPHVHIAAFETHGEAVGARRDLHRDAEAAVETRPVLDRPRQLAELAERRPFVRSRSLRAAGVSIAVGILVALTFTLFARLAGFVADLWVLGLSTAALGAMAGGLLGWLFGSASVSWCWERLMRARPDARAFLAVRIHDERGRRAFQRVCRDHGALETAAS